MRSSFGSGPRGLATFAVSMVAAVVIAAVALVALPGLAPPAQAAEDSTAPAQPVKLVFVHHSVGQNWLDDEQGRLGATLAANNYFVSDTNYGWGPDSIGDRTDIPNWPEWFTGPESSTYLSALYALSDQNSSYSRTLADPGGANQIVMFKSCFPNSSLAGNPDDPATPGYDLTVGNAKWVYNQLLTYFAAHPEKLFVVVTAPPNSESQYAANARAFNAWLLNDWRAQNHYQLANVAVFDFYNVLTGPNNHHRLVGGVETHPVTAGMNSAYYRSGEGDDHPNVAGSQKATAEFVPMLNAFYHRWQAQLQAGAPTGLFATPGNGQMAIGFTAPAALPGRPVLTYQYSTDDGGSWHDRSSGSTASPLVITGLTNGTLYRVRLRAVDARGDGSPSATLAVKPVSAASALVSVSPMRIADTRVSATSVPLPAIKAPLLAGHTLDIPVAGRTGVPPGTTAVSLNVTSVGAAGQGHLKVYPCDGSRPNVSSLNFPGGSSVANAVVTGLGAVGSGAGSVCIYASVTTDLIVDLNGWMAAGFHPLAPVRAADTRPESGIAMPEDKTPVAARQVLRLPLAGQFGVPGSAAAVVLNVTAVRPVAAGHLRVFPCGSALPNASSVNFAARSVVANAALARVGDGGEVCVFASATTDVVVDVAGWFDAGFTALEPARAADTRAGQPVVYPRVKAQVAAGQTLPVPIAGGFGVPAAASAVALNVTATGAGTAGHLRVFPCGADLPGSSSLNYPARTSVANAVLTGLGGYGAVCIYASTATDVIVDVNGSFPS